MLLATPFQRYVSGILGFLKTCLDDPERTDAFCTSSLGLIGDFGDTYKSAIKDDLMQQWIQTAISYGRQRGASKSAKNNAQYAQKVCPLPSHLHTLDVLLRCNVLETTKSSAVELGLILLGYQGII